jgi:hypothetical protein
VQRVVRTIHYRRIAYSVSMRLMLTIERTWTLSGRGVTSPRSWLNPTGKAENGKTIGKLHYGLPIMNGSDDVGDGVGMKSLASVGYAQMRQISPNAACRYTLNDK